VVRSVGGRGVKRGEPRHHSWRLQSFNYRRRGGSPATWPAGPSVESDQEECRAPVGALGFNAARTSLASQPHSWRGSNRDKLLIVSPAHGDVAHRHVRKDNGGPNEGANVMTADTLRAWAIDPAEFPLTGILVDEARFAVGYAIHSLSSHNTQPWKFPVIADELLPDRSGRRARLDPFDRALGISRRAALVKVVCARFGLPLQAATLPKTAGPDLLARIGFPHGGRVTMEPSELLASISGPATDRIRQAAAIRVARFARRRRGPSVPRLPRRRRADVPS
jgi:hypothetical protein